MDDLPLTNFRAAIKNLSGKNVELRDASGKSWGHGQIAGVGHYAGQEYLVVSGEARVAGARKMSHKDVELNYGHVAWCDWADYLRKDVAYFFALPDSPDGLRFYLPPGRKQWSPKDYPHECPRCGSPAYVGVTPGAVECTSRKCPAHDRSLV